MRKHTAALTIALLGVLATAVAAAAQTYGGTYGGGTTVLPSTGTGAGGGIAGQFPTVAVVALTLIVAAMLVGTAVRRFRTS